MIECQRTVASKFSVPGIGLHSGRDVMVTIHPAAPDHGISIAISGGSPVRLAPDRVARVPLCTRVVTPAGVIDTVEHLMAALMIVGIDNVHVDVSGNEVPVLDGSSAPWRDAIMATGIVSQPAPRRFLRIARPFEFEIGGSRYSAAPGPVAVSVTIDFPGTFIGRQSISVERGRLGELLDARTFTFESELEHLSEMGLALGGSLENAVVVGKNGPLNPDGLRGADEFVRHKALDLVGDLAFAGGPILGRVSAFRPGHAANNAFLAAMFADGILVGGHAESVRIAA